MSEAVPARGAVVVVVVAGRELSMSEAVPARGAVVVVVVAGRELSISEAVPARGAVVVVVVAGRELSMSDAVPARGAFVAVAGRELSRVADVPDGAVPDGAEVVVVRVVAVDVAPAGAALLPPGAAAGVAVCASALPVSAVSVKDNTTVVIDRMGILPS